MPRLGEHFLMATRLSHELESFLRRYIVVLFCGVDEQTFPVFPLFLCLIDSLLCSARFDLVF